MNVDAQMILALRSERAWSQEHLAEIAGLNLRTIQRIEKSGTASLQSTKALAAAFDLDVQDLDRKEQRMSPCPACRSDDVYHYREPVDTTTIGGELLPKLAPGRFSSAKILPVVCANCGYLRFYADDDARERLKDSKHWRHA
jgi:transcriptional regulator with XRE-family HTH domain